MRPALGDFAFARSRSVEASTLRPREAPGVTDGGAVFALSFVPRWLDPPWPLRM